MGRQVQYETLLAGQTLAYGKIFARSRSSAVSSHCCPTTDRSGLSGAALHRFMLSYPTYRRVSRYRQWLFQRGRHEGGCLMLTSYGVGKMTVRSRWKSWRRTITCLPLFQKSPTPFVVSACCPHHLHNIHLYLVLNISVCCSFRPASDM